MRGVVKRHACRVASTEGTYFEVLEANASICNLVDIFLRTGHTETLN